MREDDGTSGEQAGHSAEHTVGADRQLPGPAGGGRGEALRICPQVIKLEAGCREAAKRCEQLAHHLGHVRKSRAARREIPSLGHRHAGQHVVDHPGRVVIQAELAYPRQRDARLGGRPRQSLHDPQPVLGVLPVAVALHDHLAAIGEHNHVGAVGETPRGPGSGSHRSAERAFDQLPLGVLRVHNPDATGDHHWVGPQRPGSGSSAHAAGRAIHQRRGGLGRVTCRRPPPRSARDQPAGAVGDDQLVRNVTIRERANLPFWVRSAQWPERADANGAAVALGDRHATDCDASPR